MGRLAIHDTAPTATIHVCRVKVDRETGAWRITDVQLSRTVGKVLNRPEIEGQIHGGMLQSAGRVMGEEMVSMLTGT